MFGVEDHLPPRLDQEPDALADHRQVFLPADLQHFGRLEGRGLADQGDHRGGRFQEDLQPPVLLRPDPLPPRHPERADLDLLQVQSADPLEVLAVLLIRARIAPLDVVESQAVEPLGQQQLVLQRETDPFGLRAVAKSSVVDLNATHDN